MVPWLLAPAYVGVVWASLTRKWLLVAACGALVVAHLWLCLPEATADEQPAWAERAPAFTLYSGNMRYDNPDPAAVASSIVESDADVVVVNEHTPELDDALDAAGAFDRYTTVDRVSGSPFGELIMTRLPVTASGRERFGEFFAPSVTVEVGDAEVQIVAVHAPAPAKRDPSTTRWWANLELMRQWTVRESRTRPIVLAGDFNASSWNEPMEGFTESGLHNAHDVLGDGLSASWAPLSVASTLGPMIRIDHCFYTDGVSARSIRNEETPGSDHTPFFATLAVEQR
jgi:endonuclease/exonuclease/phosphatase (EEP) superfamily protein YafD